MGDFGPAHAGDSLPDSVASAIKSRGIKQLIVLGGSDRISQRALDQAKGAGVTTINRIADKDRFDIAAQPFASPTRLFTNGFSNGCDA